MLGLPLMVATIWRGPRPDRATALRMRRPERAQSQLRPAVSAASFSATMGASSLRDPQVGLVTAHGDPARRMVGVTVVGVHAHLQPCGTPVPCASVHPSADRELLSRGNCSNLVHIGDDQREEWKRFGVAVVQYPRLLGGFFYSDALHRVLSAAARRETCSCEQSDYQHCVCQSSDVLSHCLPPGFLRVRAFRIARNLYHRRSGCALQSAGFFAGSTPPTGGPNRPSNPQWSRVRSAAATAPGAVSINRPSRAASRPRADARPCSLISPAFERSRRARPSRRTACTRLFSEPGGTVWEPFGGLCTASAAAIAEGRLARAAEPDRSWAASTRKRLSRPPEPRQQALPGTEPDPEHREHTSEQPPSRATQ